MDNTRGTYYYTQLRFQHPAVESTFISVHATRIEKNGRPMCKVTPLPSIDVYNELYKVKYTQPYFWLMEVAWAKRTSHICNKIDAHRVSDSIWTDVSLRQPRKEDKALT